MRQSVSKAMDSVLLRTDYLREPRLAFAGGREDIDPKLGISKFGPRSWKPHKRHPDSVRIGLIGSGQTMSEAQQWIERTAQGVCDVGEPVEFPGCMHDRGFMSRLQFDSDWQAQLFQSEIDD